MAYDELRTRLRGVTTALVTPFENGEVAHKAFAELVEWQIGEGIHALSPCGTTGEAPTLNTAEKISLIKTCVDVCAGRVPIVAGTGTNDTVSTIALTSAAAACGADAALIVTPYYNCPSQEGLYRHFEAVARNVQIPIILYNVPKRTGVDLSLETIERLSELPTVIGIKDATGELDRPKRIVRRIDDRLIQLSGHDATAVSFNLEGGDGMISVISNVLPATTVELYEACKRADACAARTLGFKLKPLLTAMEQDTNPVPVKYALHHRRGLSPDVRLPLVGVSEETASAIRRACAAIDHVEETPSALIAQHQQAVLSITLAAR